MKSMIACLACLAATMPVEGMAEEEKAPNYAERLSGDWGGKRTDWYNRGVDLDITYKLDLHSRLNKQTNRHHVYGLDNLDVKFNLDGDKLWGWPGSRAQVYFLGNHGSKPAASNNRLPVGIDNIEVPEGGNTVKLYTAWLEKDFWDGASVKIGLYDLNTEFYATDACGMFLLPTYGMSAEMADSGLNGPSVFPTASFGVRLRYQPGPAWYAQAVVLDGSSGGAERGMPVNHKGTHVQFNKGDGTLQVVEAGYYPGEGEQRDGKVGLGAWQYTAMFDDTLDIDAAGNPVQRRRHGAYLIAEKTLWEDAGNAGHNLQGFFRYGRNDGNINQLYSTTSVGLVWHGLVSSRPDDHVGIAVSDITNSSKHQIVNGGPAYERDVEITYRAPVNSWLTLQPGLQYIPKHGNDPADDGSWWAEARVEIAF